LYLKEKEAMSDELAKLRKENKLKTSRIEALSKELAEEKEERLKMATELGQVGEHRDRLLDKVERLYADKHVLEAR
jgi:predicted nuclease with TOPRIM domain